MIVDIFNNCLTVAPMLDNLATLSPHVAVGIRTPRIGEKSPLSLTVFLCPVISGAGLIRVHYSIMVDCLRETLRSLARSYTGSSNLIQSTARCFEPNGSGTPSFIGVTTMSQNNSQDNNFAQHIFEQLNKKPIAIDFSHRLSDTDLSRTVDLTNTVDLMARRTTSILYALSVQFTDKGNVRLSDDVLVGLVDSAIQEITDINNVVSAFHAMNNEVRS